MFDGKFRTPVDKAVKPLGNALRRTGLTPDHLTVLGLLVGIGAAVAIGSGRLLLGLFLVVLAALPDLLDGALAKASESSSQRGEFRLGSHGPQVLRQGEDARRTRAESDASLLARPSIDGAISKGSASMRRTGPRQAWPFATSRSNPRSARVQFTAWSARSSAASSSGV